MAHLEFFLIAESVSVDQSTNRLSLFNILEELQPIELPQQTNYPRGAIPQLVAASSWNFDPHEYGQPFRVNLRVHLPGREQAEDLTTLEFVAERRRQRVLQMILGCPVPGPGEMRFEVLLNGQHSASHSVTVTQGVTQRSIQDIAMQGQDQHRDRVD